MAKFTNDDIKKLFDDMTPETRQILTGELKALLIPTIQGLRTAGPVVPRSDQIFNAFKLCPIERTTTVIIGQDPYHDGSAMGLSFSALRGSKIPPSLRNIYAALVSSELIPAVPKHPDLSRWASQGVLMLNTALTTAPKQAGAHTEIWKDYIAGIIGVLADRRTPMVFVLWGVHAKNIMSGITLRPNHAVFEWGHPSPMTTENRRVNDPASFINCDSFVRVNKFLESHGFPPIDWNVDENVALAAIATDTTPVITAPVLGSPLVLKPPNTLWVFTDGGATANGRAACSATWAWYATDGNASWVSRGIVEAAVVGGQTIPPSNNRGELTALLAALAWISKEGAKHSHVMVISDSEYSINSITDWYPKWKATGKLAEKKNIDLIAAAHTSYASIKSKTTIQHTRGHGDEPEDKNSSEWFIWKGNDICDKLCAQ